MLAPNPRPRLQALVLSLAVCFCACAGASRRAPPVATPPDPLSAVDAFALAAPPQSRSSVQALGAYLAGAGPGEADRARAVYCWITRNVRYDLEGYRASHFGDLSPETVLRSGKSVCEGFSNLFESLARTAGLEAVTIPGYAKGLGYEAGGRFSGPPNHAWNAVKIDGAWRLVDCTWGAGALDENGVYRRRFEPFFFLTPPEDLAYTHFPLDPRWQMLEKPLTLEEFERLPFVKEPFFHYGLRLLSHRECVIDSPSRNLTVEIGTPEGTLLLAKLYRGVQVGEVPVTRNGERDILRVFLPGDETCILRIFAAKKGPEGTGVAEYDWAMDYKVVWERGR